jgi:hypothetical protein
MKIITESVNNCGAPSVIEVIATAHIGESMISGHGCGSTYEIARGNAYQQLALNLLNSGAFK